MSAMHSAAALLAGAQSVVIKVGSSLLVDDGSQLRSAWLGSLAKDIVSLLADGKRVTVVSSGAVALGAGALAAPASGLALVHKQAAAAVGQIHLAQAWRQALDDAGAVCAQVLLTPQDTEDRRRHLNARATLAALAADGIVAIINENDTVATDELRYGDNDRLAARVAQMISADLLILLSDVDGVYDADPALVPGATRIEHITDIDASLLRKAGDSSSGFGTGGMRSKLAAAAIAMPAGSATIIASGERDYPIRAIAQGANASVFAASASTLSARRKWILASLRKPALVTVDAGAVAALEGGSSLLPVGVVGIEGEFERGDCISICRDDAEREELGVGLASLDSSEARAAIAGARSGERTALLVHRDNLALHA